MGEHGNTRDVITTEHFEREHDLAQEQQQADNCVKNCSKVFVKKPSIFSIVMAVIATFGIIGMSFGWGNKISERVTKLETEVAGMTTMAHELHDLHQKFCADTAWQL